MAPGKPGVHAHGEGERVIVEARFPARRREERGESNDTLPLAMRMDTWLPWRHMRGSLANAGDSGSNPVLGRFPQALEQLSLCVHVYHHKSYFPLACSLQACVGKELHEKRACLVYYQISQV